jgi:hypothetical protein
MKKLTLHLKSLGDRMAQSQTYELFLSSSGLKNIPRANYPNDFTFVAGPTRLSCPSFVAEFLSPRICCLRWSDPTISEFVLHTPDRCGGFAAFLAIGQGMSLSVTSQNIDFLKSICHELENGDLASQLQSADKFELTIENAIERLKWLEFVLSDNSREVEFIATHFPDFPESEFSTLTLESLYSILSQPVLELESEDRLYAFICHRISSDPSYFSLFELVQFDFLSMDSLRDFIQLVTARFGYFTFSIWERVQVRLARSPAAGRTDTRHCRFDRTDCPFILGAPLTGIIARLSAECDGNVHKRRVVRVTASSERGSSYASSNVIDLSANTEWLSQGETPDQWLCYDFQGRTVEVTNYSIQSADVSGGSPRNFPKSWVLEGSQDGSQWVVLDERTNNRDLKGQSQIASFLTSTRQVSRLIRIRQTGPNHNNEPYFGFRALELFGCLFSPRASSRQT